MKYTHKCTACTNLVGTDLNMNPDAVLCQNCTGRALMSNEERLFSLQAKAIELKKEIAKINKYLGIANEK